jgi:hypothetical protein
MRTKGHDLNEAAYRRLEESMKHQYPYGQFVAFMGGQIVADAADFDELDSLLLAKGKDPRKAFVVQAGHVYPRSAIIL